MTNLRALMDSYVIALNAGAEAATDPRERFDYADLFAAAHRMQAAVEANDLGQLAAVLYDATRLVGWMQLRGEAGTAVHEDLHTLNEAVLRARLEGRPPAW